MSFEPKLVKEQFDEKNQAAIILQFANKEFYIAYHNPKRLGVGQYEGKEISVDGTWLCGKQKKAVLERKRIEEMTDESHQILIELGEKEEESSLSQTLTS